MDRANAETNGGTVVKEPGSVLGRHEELVRGALWTQSLSRVW